jgi:hypothetical protein
VGESEAANLRQSRGAPTLPQTEILRIGGSSPVCMPHGENFLLENAFRRFPLSTLDRVSRSGHAETWTPLPPVSPTIHYHPTPLANKQLTIWLFCLLSLRPTPPIALRDMALPRSPGCCWNIWQDCAHRLDCGQGGEYSPRPEPTRFSFTRRSINQGSVCFGEAYTMNARPTDMFLHPARQTVGSHLNSAQPVDLLGTYSVTTSSVPANSQNPGAVQCLSRFV